MAGVIEGFGVIAAIVLVGHLLGKLGVLGDSAQHVLSRTSFYVGTPALMLAMLSRSTVSVIFSIPLLVSALSTLAVASVFILVGALRRWSVHRTTIGALCSSYVNAGNLGIPIAVYVLGNAALVAPIMLFQILVITPMALTVIDLSLAEEHTPMWRRVLAPFSNPIVVCALAGLIVSITGWKIPDTVLEPVRLLGNTAVPSVLLAFGLSLSGNAWPRISVERWPVLLSVALKSIVHPIAAWMIGAGVFGLHGATLFAVVVTSALPAAQNLFTYAARYNVGVQLARESILLSTIMSVPVLVAVAALLG